MERPSLENILENYTIESSADFYEGDFRQMIQDQMPDYDVEVWDMDEFNFGPSVGDTIAATIIGKTVEDMQTMEWCTDNQDCYMYVVAIKLKGK